MNNSRPHAPMRFRAYVEEIDGILQLSLLGNYSDVNIEIPDADVMLDEQKKFAEQPEKVMADTASIAATISEVFFLFMKIPPNSIQVPAHHFSLAGHC